MTKKLLQINPVVRLNTSTGRIMREIGELAISAGWESYVAYSGARDGMPAHSSHLVPVGDKLDLAVHAVATRLFDAHGLASRRGTKQLIRRIREIDPDVISGKNRRRVNRRRPRFHLCHLRFETFDRDKELGTVFGHPQGKLRPDAFGRAGNGMPCGIFGKIAVAFCFSRQDLTMNRHTGRLPVPEYGFQRCQNRFQSLDPPPVNRSGIRFRLGLCQQFEQERYILFPELSG